MGRTWGGNSCHLRTKLCGLGSVKRTNSLCGKSPTQKGTFRGQCPSPVIVCFGDFRDFQPLALTPAQFCCFFGEQGTPLPLLHMCSSGTPCLCPRPYKAGMGRISCRCGTESKGFPKMDRTQGGNLCCLRTKPCGLGSPKRTNSLCGKSPTHNQIKSLLRCY